MFKDWTLVEVLIVVSIVGLIAAIVIPSFYKARKDKMKAQVVEAQKMAYNEKISRGSTYSIGSKVISTMSGMRGQVVEIHAPNKPEDYWEYDVRFWNAGTNVFMVTLKDFELAVSFE